MTTINMNLSQDYHYNGEMSSESKSDSYDFDCEMVTMTDNASSYDDNLDSNPEYKDYWFVGQTRLSGYEVKPDIYYWIRLKNESWSYATYKLKEKKGNKIVFECRHDDTFHGKIIELDIDNIYVYEMKW
jgi:hypothetical protein